MYFFFLVAAYGVQGELGAAHPSLTAALAPRSRSRKLRMKKFDPGGRRVLTSFTLPKMPYLISFLSRNGEGERN